MNNTHSYKKIYFLNKLINANSHLHFKKMHFLLKSNKHINEQIQNIFVLFIICNGKNIKYLY